MGKIIAGEFTVDFADERAFAHVRSAVIALITAEEKSFFIESGIEEGRVGVLCGPNLPLKFQNSGALLDDDNDTWVSAIVATTLVTGSLTMFPEDQAGDVLAKALAALDEQDL